MNRGASRSRPNRERTSPDRSQSRNGYNEAVVRAFFREYGVPEPEFEHKFCERKWRFDLVWIAGSLLAIEVQGGLFSGGAHVRGSRMLQEFDKWNRATVIGWRILFVTPQQLLTKQTVDMVRACLDLCPVPGKHIGQTQGL